MWEYTSHLDELKLKKILQHIVLNSFFRNEIKKESTHEIQNHIYQYKNQPPLPPSQRFPHIKPVGGVLTNGTEHGSGDQLIAAVLRFRWRISAHVATAIGVGQRFFNRHPGENQLLRRNARRDGIDHFMRQRPGIAAIGANYNLFTISE